MHERWWEAEVLCIKEEIKIILVQDYIMKVYSAVTENGNIIDDNLKKTFIILRVDRDKQEMIRYIIKIITF